MKTLIATSIIALSSSAALAESFAYERQVGAPALFPTLVLEQSASQNTGVPSSTSFAYERQIGTPELFPTLNAEGYEPNPSLGEVMVDTPRVPKSIWGWDIEVGG